MRKAPSPRQLRPLLVIILIACSLAPAEAKAERQLTTGLLEVLWDSPDPAVRDLWFDRALEAQAGLIRTHVFWSSVAASEPENPSDPSDPAYDWGALDTTVREARARGLEVLLTVTGAPAWAEGKGRPEDASPGSWKPRPDAFGDFAHAVAARYSGTVGGLPRVRYFQAWNEPNLSVHLTPQYGARPRSRPARYRDLLNAFYDGRQGRQQDNQVVTGGTAPYGDPPGGTRTRPLTFWRDVLCLKGRQARARTECPTKAKFDILAHHPINTSGGPHAKRRAPRRRLDSGLQERRQTLRAAERHRDDRRLTGRHPVWATELWWDSNPPDTVEGVSLRKHARYIEQALYLLWKQGASVVINLQLRDTPFDGRLLPATARPGSSSPTDRRSPR